MARHIAIVTDSTASLPAGLVDAAGIVVVPLDVIVDGVSHREGMDISPRQIVEALRSGASVRTAQPAAASTVRFAVDTLEHLRAGGRLGAFAATLGTVLGLRPVLAIRDGRLDVVE